MLILKPGPAFEGPFTGKLQSSSVKLALISSTTAKTLVIDSEAEQLSQFLFL